ncbi:MAG: tetratricopeptide repeat protein [Rhodospirillales bacterium]|mgnify:CR=1 FL=1|tara:strand:- start:7012 stop:8970 length:1959 start_codon:yes stop_codon:yes gene_type:complete
MARAEINQALKLHQEGNIDQAEDLYLEILSREPENQDALHFLGLVSKQRGSIQLAIEYITRAISIEPDRETFHYNIGLIFAETGDLKKGRNALEIANELKPGSIEILLSLGMLQGQTGDNGIAEATFNELLDIDPDNGSALVGLTAVLNRLDRYEDAERIGHRSIQLAPSSCEAWTNLGNSLHKQSKKPGNLKKAEKYFRQALKIKPEYTTALFNLGNVLNDQWINDEAIRCFEKVIKIDPNYFAAWQSFLMNLLYNTDQTEETLFNYHKKWVSSYYLSSPSNNVSINIKKTEKIRIGYVSPDFRRHSCAYFLKSIFEYYNNLEFEVFVYSNVTKSDEITSWFRKHCDHWLDITRETDQEVIRQIKNDKIDILVDLAGLSKGNRISIFAEKPARIQISWLGYPGTIGLPEISYRITDDIADPEGLSDNYHVEKLVRLDGGFHCYTSYEELPEVKCLPQKRNKFITFGSFNNILKVSQEVIKTWSDILNSVEKSRLVIKGRMIDYTVVRERIRNEFSQHNVSSNRVEFMEWVPRDQRPLEKYNSIDIALDTFPYNGTTTSFEAIVMGVPVITLRGTRHAARVGASIMTRIGCKELIGESESQYVQIAQSLANDIPRLQRYRENLRINFEKSPYGNPIEFTRKFEETFKSLYKN